MNFSSSPKQTTINTNTPRLSRVLVSLALISLLISCSPDNSNGNCTINQKPTASGGVFPEQNPGNNLEPDNFEPNNPEPASQGDADNLELYENYELSEEDLDKLGISEDMTKVPPFPENGSKEDFANAIHKAKLTRQLRASADPFAPFRREMADAHITMLDEYYEAQMAIEEVEQRTK